jgi:hypothetical protein
MICLIKIAGNLFSNSISYGANKIIVLKLIKRLVLREDSNGLVNVVGLVEMQIKSVAQLKKVINHFKVFLYFY